MKGTEELKTELAKVDERLGELNADRLAMSDAVAELEAEFVSGTVAAKAVHQKRAELESTSGMIASIERRRDALQDELRVAQSTKDYTTRVKELKAAAEAGSLAVGEYFDLRKEFNAVIAGYAARLNEKLAVIGENKRTFRSGIDYLTGPEASEGQIVADVLAAGASSEAVAVIRSSQIKTSDAGLPYGREVALIEGVYNARKEKEQRRAMAA